MKLDDSTRKYLLFFLLIMIFIFYITIFRNYYEGLGDKLKDELKKTQDDAYNKKLEDEKRKIISDHIKNMDDEQLHQVIKTIEQIKRDF